MSRPAHSSPALALLTLAAASCGPASRRDLSQIPQRQITFDDLCHLQAFFDQRNATRARPFRAVDEQSTETANAEPDEQGRMQRVMVGEGTYIVTRRSDRRRFVQLLEEEYTRLPDAVRSPESREIRVRVEWWASGQMRRLRPDREIEVTTEQGTARLPFNPCVGEFLFGAPIYAMRRHFLESENARAAGREPPPPLQPPSGPEPAEGTAPPPLPEVPAADGGVGTGAEAGVGDGA